MNTQGPVGASCCSLRRSLANQSCILMSRLIGNRHLSSKWPCAISDTATYRANKWCVCIRFTKGSKLGCVGASRLINIYIVSHKRIIFVLRASGGNSLNIGRQGCRVRSYGTRENECIYHHHHIKSTGHHWITQVNRYLDHVTGKAISGEYT